MTYMLSNTSSTPIRAMMIKKYFCHINYVISHQPLFGCLSPESKCLANIPPTLKPPVPKTKPTTSSRSLRLSEL